MAAKDVMFIIGDFNAKVGEGEESPAIGKFGLDERNDAGDRLVQCCQENWLIVANTWFKQPKRHLYTWTALDGKHRNQIDYVLCQQRWKSSVQAIKTQPGADCGSEHQLLIAKVEVRFTSCRRVAAVKRFDVSNTQP